MKKKTVEFIVKTVVVYLVLLVLMPKRYKWYLPTIPLYPNSIDESRIVERMAYTRSPSDVAFFKLTDRSVSDAFVKVVPVSVEELDKTIQRLVFEIMLIKNFYNRPRPVQMNENINVLTSTTAATPAYPAGHAYQAYYLAKTLGKKYPEAQHILNDVAKECDECRIKAGLHYPSDGAFSKYLIDSIY